MIADKAEIVPNDTLAWFGENKVPLVIGSIAVVFSVYLFRKKKVKDE